MKVCKGAARNEILELKQVVIRKLYKVVLLKSFFFFLLSLSFFSFSSLSKRLVIWRISHRVQPTEQATKLM